MPEINFSEGVTKKLFGFKGEHIEDMPTETNLSLSSQEYFSKNVNLKFIEANNLELNNRIFPKLNIIKNEAGIKNSKENIENNQINIFQSIKISSTLKTDWRAHEFKNILFDPNSLNSVFFTHLIQTFKGLAYAQSILRPTNLGGLQNKMVKLLSNCKLFF